MFLFRFSGWFLFRFEQRRFSDGLLKVPPRSTRDTPFTFGPAAPLSTGRGPGGKRA